MWVMSLMQKEIILVERQINIIDYYWYEYIFSLYLYVLISVYNINLIYTLLLFINTVL